MLEFITEDNSNNTFSDVRSQLFGSISDAKLLIKSESTPLISKELANFSFFTVEWCYHMLYSELWSIEMRYQTHGSIN